MSADEMKMDVGCRIREIINLPNHPGLKRLNCNNCMIERLFFEGSVFLFDAHSCSWSVPSSCGSHYTAIRLKNRIQKLMSYSGLDCVCES